MKPLILFIMLIIIIATLYYFRSPHIVQDPYHINIQTRTLENPHYRMVDYTTPNMQMVYMNIPSGQDIKKETHPSTSQFIRVESGKGRAVIDGKEYQLSDDMGIIVPPGAEHQIFSDDNLKLYSIYTPPEHPVGLIQTTRPE